MSQPANNNKEQVIEQAVQKFVDAQLQGHRLNIDEFVKQYPDVEEQLRQKIQNLQKIDGLFNCLMQADDSDYREAVIEHDLIGKRLGDFEIVNLIGTGGMGAVFLARQVSLDREVALKVISDISGARAKSLERFKREAKVLAKISYPHIVSIYEVGEEGPYSYFAMEYVQGVSLDKILASIRNAPSDAKASEVMRKCLEDKSSIQEREYAKSRQKDGAEIDTDYIVGISKIIISIASALENAHSKGILHRDVKPSNILIDSNGTPKLVDFGLARAESQQAITVTGEFFGTPSYVSPEQIRRPDTVDCRSDVYSLAATYYECLTLRPPFEGNTVNETLTRVISREAVPPKKFCPRLSTDFNTVLLHALEKLPEDRYQTAADFAADIEHVLEFKPITAKRPSITRRTYKIIRRNPVRTVTVLVAIIATIIVIALTVFYVRENKIADAGRLHAEGLAKMASGHHAEALVCFKKALVKDPTHVQAAYLGALCYQELGDPNKAILLYKHAVEIGPNCAEAHFGLALGYQVLRRWKESIGPLQKAVMLEPNNANYKEVLAAGYQQSENYQDAIKTYREYLAVKPDNASVCNRLGYCCSMYKQYGDAIQAYKKAIQLEPKNVTAYSSLSWCYFELGEYKLAVNNANEAIKLQPSNIDALKCMASSYLGLGQQNEFIDTSKKILAIDPNYSIISFVEAQKYINKKGAGSVIGNLKPNLQNLPIDPNLAEKLVLAIWYTQMNRIEDSIGAYQEAIKINPNSAITYSLLGISYQALGRHNEAIDAFRKSIKLEPNNHFYSARDLDLARSLAITLQYQEAMAYYKKYISYNPDSEDAWGGMGTCFYNLKNYGEAARCYEKVIQLKPDLADVYIYLLMTYEKLHWNEKTVPHIALIIKLKPKDILPTICLNAWGYTVSGYTDALESYLQKNPSESNYVRGFFNYCLAESWSVLGKQKEANEAYTEAKKIYQQLRKTNSDEIYNAYILWGLGSSYYGLKQYGDAIITYDEAIKRDPNFVATYAKKAFLYATCPNDNFRNGEKAVKLATKACELTNYESDACTAVLAAAYAESGDFEKAIEYQKKAIEIAAEDQAKKEYEKRLEAYKAHKPWRE